MDFEKKQLGNLPSSWIINFYVYCCIYGLTSEGSKRNTFCQKKNEFEIFLHEFFNLFCSRRKDLTVIQQKLVPFSNVFFSFAFCRSAAVQIDQRHLLALIIKDDQCFDLFLSKNQEKYRAARGIFPWFFVLTPKLQIGVL